MDSPPRHADRSWISGRLDLRWGALRCGGLRCGGSLNPRGLHHLTKVFCVAKVVANNLFVHCVYSQHKIHLALWKIGDLFTISINLILDFRFSSQLILFRIMTHERLPF
eukprot:SAG11_NODE_7448_length_1142_cov_1.912752_1_plen_108_part_10